MNPENPGTDFKKSQESVFWKSRDFRILDIPVGIPSSYSYGSLFYWLITKHIIKLFIPYIRWYLKLRIWRVRIKQFNWLALFEHEQMYTTQWRYCCFNCFHSLRWLLYYAISGKAYTYTTPYMYMYIRKYE